MGRRAPLQALLQLQSAHAMATRAVWQRGMHELAGLISNVAFVAGVEAAAGKATSRASRSISVGGYYCGVAEQARLLTSFPWGRAAGSAARASSAAPSGRVFCSARQCNTGSSISGGEFSSRVHFPKPYAMQFSTVSASEQSAPENVSAANLTSTETVVVEAEATSSELEFAPENESTSSTLPVQSIQVETVVVETKATPSELEFAPEIESTPSTTLVQAIQLQESVSSEDVSSSSPHEQLRDVFSDTESPPALQNIDADRVVHPRRIYIGGLPFSMKGDELKDALRELCGKYGIVMEVNLAQHRHQSKKSIESGKHRGFAFVMMETHEQAEEVIANLNGTTVWERVLMVSYGLKKIEPDPAQKLGGKEKLVLRRKIFVGNLRESTSADDLLAKFKEYGNVIDVKLVAELHSNRSRGFGFVTFAEESDAIKAVLDSDGSILDGSVLRVNIAKYPQGY